jgi:hypothetical protein
VNAQSRIALKDLLDAAKAKPGRLKAAQMA